jgi:type II secretory pathway pseudopilin PulG
MFCQKCGNELQDGAIFCAKCGMPVAGATPVQIPVKSKPVPIFLILIIIAGASIPFLGIIAAIAIPNFLRATDKAHYTRCAQALSGLKVAEEMYLSDNNIYADNSSRERLGMYMIPGCTNPNGCGTRVSDRIKGKLGEKGNCKDFEIVTMPGPNGIDYQITGTANDRRQCKICVTARGFVPQTYSGCSSGMQCP